MAILGAALSFAGVYLLMIGGRTPYFVVAGIGIAISGVFISAGRMFPRMFLPTLIGLYLLSDKVRPRLN
ncbi:MAG TPA: hypothetical protein VN256_00400 [Pyrinomonadaceae bacterium]|nr:hypothetical protein [Pyrinomonadaceae bacterium]